MLKFIVFSVDRVIFCTSRAWMVAPRALAFWSSQKCTALSSSMRFSSSSTLKVGATQWLRLGSCGMFCPMPWAMPPAACVARPCRKSNPGTNLPKPLADGSLIACSSKGCRGQPSTP